MRHIVRLVEGDPPPRPDKRSRLGNDLLWLWNIDQHKTRSDEVEGGSRQTGDARIPLEHFDVPETALRDHASREGDRVRTSLDTHHAPRRSNAVRQEIETTVRPAADLDHPCTGPYADLIEQPA